MRLPLIAPTDLTSEQRPIYEDMRAGIGSHFQGFSSIADNGALMGLWNPWLHEPKFGNQFGNSRKRSPSHLHCRNPFEKWRSSLLVRSSELLMRSTRMLCLPSSVAYPTKRLPP
jgi:hypothetical protein